MQASHNNIESSSQPYAAYHGVPVQGGQQVVAAQPIQQYYVMNYMGQVAQQQQQQQQQQYQQQQQQYPPAVENAAPPPAAYVHPPTLIGYNIQRLQQQQQQQQQQYLAPQVPQPPQQQVIQQPVAMPSPQQQQQQYQRQSSIQNNIQIVPSQGVAAAPRSNNMQMRLYETRRESKNVGGENDRDELNLANTMSSNIQDIENNNYIRRSKSDAVWGDYVDSPKSVAAKVGGGLSISATPPTLNPAAQDFVPKKQQEIVTVSNYQRQQNGNSYQNRSQNRDRGSNMRGGYNRGGVNTSSYYNNNGRRGGGVYMKSGVNNMRQQQQQQYPSDPHQTARKRVKQCVNKVRDLLDNFANHHQLDAFYPDQQDTLNYCDALMSLSSSMLEEIDHIISQPNRV